MRMISDQIALHSVQLQLKILHVKTDSKPKRYSSRMIDRFLNDHGKYWKAEKRQDQRSLSAPLEFE